MVGSAHSTKRWPHRSTVRALRLLWEHRIVNCPIVRVRGNFRVTRRRMVSGPHVTKCRKGVASRGAHPWSLPTSHSADRPARSSRTTSPRWLALRSRRLPSLGDHACDAILAIGRKNTRPQERPEHPHSADRRKSLEITRVRTLPRPFPPIALQFDPLVQEMVEVLTVVSA